MSGCYLEMEPVGLLEKFADGDEEYLPRYLSRVHVSHGLE